MNADDFVRRVLGFPVTNSERAERINTILTTRPPSDPTRQRIEELLQLARQRRAIARGEEA